MNELTPHRPGGAQGSPVRLPFLEEATKNPAAEPQRASAIAPPDDSLEEANAQARRRSWLKWSAVVAIALPTVVAALYYGLIASDQYAVEVRFAVRGAQQGPSSDLLGMFTNTAVSGTTTNDSYIAMDFIRSRELIDKLEADVSIRKIYSTPKADYFSRLDPEAPIEDVHDYWKNMIELGFDASSQVVAMKVRAFTPEDATRLAQSIVQHSEDLINSLSIRAREDAISFARAEVSASEERLQSVRSELLKFRDTRQELDPLKTAEAQLGQISRLEGEIAAAKAQVQTLGNYMQKDAPNITFLNAKIRSLEQQLAEERNKLGQGQKTADSDATLSEALSDYERLKLELEFAQKAYVSALTALERARLEALQQQRYLAVFVRPKLPETAEYPKRFVITLTVFGAAVVLWAIGVLIVYAIRDHTA